jgi:predicted Zn-dependent peptidase
VIPAWTLSSGAKVVAERVPGSLSASVGLWVPWGSRLESSAERGFSHFVEHMLFKGTSRRSAFELAREVDREGGYLNAFTERSCACYHCTIPSKSLRVAVDALCDMFSSSRFELGEFAKEKAVIESEVLAAADDHEDASYDAFLETIWPGSGAAQKIAGEAEDVRRVGRDALYDFYRGRYRPENLLITVSGDFDEARLREWLEEGLAPAAPALAGPRPSESGSRGTGFELPFEAPAFTPGRRSILADSGIAHVYAAAQARGPFSESDYFAWEVLSAAYGESMSSRLFQELRERRGLCYSVYSFFAMFRDFSLFSVYASATEERLGELLAALEESRATLLRDGLDDEELESAKSHLAGSILLSSEDSEERMKRLARQWLFSGQAETMGESLERIAAISQADVRAAAKAALGGDGALVVYGPRAARRAMRKQGGRQ